MRRMLHKPFAALRPCCLDFLGLRFVASAFVLNLVVFRYERTRLGVLNSGVLN